MLNVVHVVCHDCITGLPCLRPIGRHAPARGVRTDAAESPDELARRYDAASRAVLAEAAPLALPDGRWDKMVYPIRDCEQFLKAIC